MESIRIVFCDGQFLLEQDLRLPFTDRAFLFGDGVFTTVRVCDGVIESWDTHIKRLQRNCFDLSISLPSIDIANVQELIRRNRAKTGVWRLKIIITGGESPSLDLAPRTFGHLIMTLTPFQVPPIPYTLALCSTPVIRPTSHIKSLSYLDRLWVMEEGKKQGFHDAITTTPEGFLLEAAFSNIFWKSQNCLYTPAESLPLLPGVSLVHVKEAAMASGMEVQEVRCTLADIPDDAQVYICNSMVRLHPVGKIQDRVFI